MAQSARFRGSFDPLGADSVRALCKLLNPEDEDEVELAGRTVQRSHMSPGDLHEGNKPTAKPNVKVRRPHGLSRNDKSTSLNGNTPAGQGKDSRVLPEYEILHQQTVGSEDVFLGISGKDPSSDHCDKLVAKVKLPDTELKAITLEVEDHRLLVETPVHRLNLPLSNPGKGEPPGHRVPLRRFCTRERAAEPFPPF
uniref:Sarcoma antigen NY-SAR-97, putative n=1 Tax=Neospora caninum (strain Liverpool) TaxID=572307 RepID=A0A0F7UQK3_NEOCL|nr:TPA: sarcoma antigen NY-SAR-97, putative [Neospora caninum Liverpool]